MEADLWTAFTFFGIPLALGILGVLRGAKLCYRGYTQYVTPAVAVDPAVDAVEDEADGERSWRENLTIGSILVVGAGLLVAHSGRWLVRIL